MKTEMLVGLHNIAQNEGKDQALAAIAGRRAWILSDGVAGHQAITGGIADCLQLDSEVKSVHPRNIWRHLAPNGPADPRVLCDLMASPLPEIALGAGRQTVPFIRALRKAGVFTVIFQAPRTWRNSSDLIWAPAHDALKGENVITTLTPPHRFTPERIEETRSAISARILDMPRPCVTLLIGGPGAGYRYDRKTIARFARGLEEISKWAGGFLVSSSRRTPPDLFEAVSKATGRRPGILWGGQGENPYPQFLAAADVFIVTADSVNMTGEACATGRPIFVFHPHGGRAKFRVFHKSLEDYGATRPFDAALGGFEPWRYEPLVATDAVAGDIARRWLAHHQQTVSNSR